MPSPASGELLAHDLLMACLKVSRRTRFEGTSIPPHQFNVLAWVGCEPLTAGEVADREKVSAPSMSRTVGCLVERGFLSRATDPADNRRLILSLTESGAAALTTARIERDTWLTERLTQCTPGERKMLRHAADILDRLVGE